MSNFPLGEAVLGTAMDLQGLRKGMQEAEGESKTLWGRIGGIAENALGFLTGNVLTKGFDAVVNVAREIGATMLTEAPRVEQLRTSFENLAASAGVSADEVLASMRRAANGMVTDASLMESYNSAMLLVGESMADKFPALLQIAQASAAATGQDVGFLLDSLVKGIGRGSPMILDNLGLTINLAAANAEYAKSLGITVDEMTKAQQQEALLNAVLAAGDGFVERLGDNTGGTAASLAQLRTTFDNLKMDLAVGLLPALQAILEPLGALASKYAPQIAEFGKTAGKWLGENLPRVIDALKALFEGDLTTAISNVGAILSTTFGRDVAQTFMGTVDKIRGVIEDISNSIGIFFYSINNSGDPLEAISEALVNFPDLKAKFDVIVPIIRNVVAWFGIARDTISPLISEVATGFLSARDTVLGAVEAIKGWFDANGTTIMAGFLTGWVLVKDTVLAAVDVIWPAVQSMGASLGQIFGQIGDNLGALGLGWDDLGKVVGAVLTVIGALLLVAVGVIAGAFNGIAALLESLANSFEIWSQKVFMVIESFKIWWTNVTTFITALFSGDWATAIDALGKTWESWWELVGGVLDLFRTTIGATFDAVISLVSGFVDGFVGFIGSLIDRLNNFSLREVGIGLIAGFIDGIKSAASAVADAVGNVIQGGIDAAKNLLLMDSPSKVFEEMGQFSGEGYEIGLRESSAGVAVAGTSMATQALQGASAAGSGFTMGGFSVQIGEVHIHDDRDVDDLVEQISARLGAALEGRLRPLRGAV